MLSTHNCSKLAVAVLVAACLSHAALEASALSCDRVSDCGSVTKNKKYVQCVAGECQCLTDNGFAGNATTANKCQCVSPNGVYWDDEGEPFCIQFQNAVAYAREQERNAVLEAKVRQIYQSLVYPTPAIIMNAIIQGVPPTDPAQPMSQLFAPNASGRVDPVGEFLNFDGIVEYFYGAVWLDFSIITTVNFKKLVVNGNQVAVRVDLTTQNSLGAGLPPMIINLTQSGVFTFNDQNLVQKAELIVHNLGWSNAERPQFDLPTICTLILDVAHCNNETDPAGHYANKTDCENFLGTIPFGQWDLVRSNTVVCRAWHTLLAVGRPQVHCPHVGKTGGGKCEFHHYSDYYNVDF